MQRIINPLHFLAGAFANVNIAVGLGQIIRDARRREDMPQVAKNMLYAAVALSITVPFLIHVFVFVHTKTNLKFFLAGGVVSSVVYYSISMLKDDLFSGWKEMARMFGNHANQMAILSFATIAVGTIIFLISVCTGKRKRD